MRRQVRRQFVDGHPVHTGAALVLPHALQRRRDIAALDHPLHQAVVSRASVSAHRRQGFAASLALGGFTPCLQRELQLPGLLVPGPSETHGRFALPSVRPFTPLSVQRYYGLG